MPLAIIESNTQRPKRNENVELPNILKTPSGLVLIEIQGSIHIGNRTLSSAVGLGLQNENEYDINIQPSSTSDETDLIGKFDFSDLEKGGNSVTLVVDQHQRLRGKLEKLKKPLAILRIDEQNGEGTAKSPVMIPVVDIVSQKLIFSSRPEPIVYTEQS